MSIKHIHPLLLAIFLPVLSVTGLAAAGPNVIFLAVDDMNDWSGPLGSKQAKTPNMDRLAEMGVTFTNAHTAGIYCAPSRSAIFTGRYATTTGVYSGEIYFYDHPEYRPLQVAFKEGGYKVYGTGKLFHHPAGAVDLRGWDEFHVRTEIQKTTGWPMDGWEHGAPLPDPYPHSKFNQINPKWAGRPFMEGGPIPNDKADSITDTIRTRWACDVLKQQHEKPFFLALGLYAPHFPNYAPQKFFDMYPIESIQRPQWKADDLDDLPEPVRRKYAARKKGIHDKLLELGIVDSTLQAYLASISYADSLLGRVLDTLENSPHADNTIIVFWSDHGYAHGEKGNWGKHTLWQRTSNIPFLWAGPGIARNAKTEYTATLIDMYPTLAQLCDLPKDPEHDGQSLASVLKNPSRDGSRSVLLPHDHPGSYAIINRDWRYIYYQDGSEELYDVSADFHEWDNLAGNAEFAGVKDRLKAQAPSEFAPHGTPKNSLRMVTEGRTFHWAPKGK
jgi:arylsulfatase A-like enzyme